MGKLINHLSIYEQIINLPGAVLEFGVYKGTSLIRLLTFRELLETQYSRKIIAFDIFGKFPDNVALDTDKRFIKNFESAGGVGIDEQELKYYLQKKGFVNYELVKGNILETLPRYLDENPHLKISLLHIDVDVYEPTKLILELLWDHIVPGGILMLDDYGTVYGSTKAVDEFFAGKDVKFYKPRFNYIPTYTIK